jgi:hypothetical protein
MSTKKKPYPIYDGNYRGIKRGLYLALFHGFRNEKERGEADDWGANGPLIGPLKYVHTTYACRIHIEFEKEQDAEKYGFNDNDPDLCIGKDGCVGFKSMRYGDWTVFNLPRRI